MITIALTACLVTTFFIALRTPRVVSRCFAYKIASDIFSVILISSTVSSDDGSARLMALTVLFISSTAIYLQIYANIKKSIKKVGPSFDN